jgi:hypothetical protein
MDVLLRNVLCLVYRGRVCHLAETDGKLIASSVKARVSLEIYVLLTDRTRVN